MDSLSLDDHTLELQFVNKCRSVLSNARVTRNDECLHIPIVPLLQKILLGEMGKTNTIALIGPSNVGKTMLMRLFTAGLCVGTFNTQYSLRSPFWLSHLVDKDIYVGEEFACDRDNVDIFKQLVESSH